MATAAALVEGGFIEDGGRITIIEAKSRTGGRAGSFYDTDTNQEIDYCQHVAMACCTNLLHLLRWANLESEFVRYSQLYFLSPQVPSSTFYPNRWLPAPLHLAPAFANLQILTQTERFQVARGLWRLMRMSISKRRRLSESRRPLTMGQWLRANGQSEGCIRKFWNLVLASALGEHVDAVAIAPARKVFVDGFLNCHGAADVLVPRQPLSELFGRRLPKTLRDAGVQILHQRRVRQCVVIDESKIELRTDNLQPITADFLVSAVPWYALPRLLKNSALRETVSRLDDIGLFPASPISGVHLWLDKPVTELPHAVMAETLSQWLFSNPKDSSTVGKSGRAEEQKSHYYQVVISAAQDVRGRNPLDLERQIVAELNEVFKPTAPVTALRGRIVTDPQAVFSITPDVERVRPHVETKAPNFFLAGDWVQTGWPATMESAVISGFQAAEAIGRACGTQLAAVQAPLRPGRLAKWLVR